MSRTRSRPTFARHPHPPTCHIRTPTTSTARRWNKVRFGSLRSIGIEREQCTIGVSHKKGNIYPKCPILARRSPSGIFCITQADCATSGTSLHWRDADVKTQSDVIDLVSRQKELNFKPGEEFLYCNTGYTLLTEIIDRVAGQSLPEFADEHIFKPLGMKNSLFIGNHLEIIKNRTYAYAPRSGGDYIINNFAGDIYGATSLFTTVDNRASLSGCGHRLC
jgi:hypothetical protein